MKSNTENSTLAIFLEGRIDADSAPQVEAELLAKTDESPDLPIVIDASELAYISSAGLRVLMKLRKRTDKPIRIINVSPAVYEIFNTTGFTDLLDIEKAMRTISIEGLEQIGIGATASVYRLDRETIVKVFNNEVSPEMIRQENEHSRNAFISGIPTAIAYDIVKVGDCFGAVYELLDAQDLVTVIENDREHMADHIRDFAVTMRKLHEIEVDPTKFPPTKQSSIAVLPHLASICTQEEIDKLRRLYESIPDRNTFLQGDCHPGNVMVRDGEFTLIDLMVCGCGHPIFDMGSMCALYLFSQKDEKRRATSPLLTNFSTEEMDLIWKTFLTAYLDMDDPVQLAEATQQIVAVCAARNLFAAVFIPGLLPPEVIESAKQTALSYVDRGIKPICF